MKEKLSEMIQLPGLADTVVALTVVSSATAIIVGVVSFSALHALFYKVLPAYCALLGTGLLLNLPQALDYAPPALKVLRRVRDGHVILKIISMLLLSYSAAVYNVGNSNCSKTKSANALLFSAGAAAVLLSSVEGVTVQEWMTHCTSKPNDCTFLVLAVGSLLVALFHHFGPIIENYLEKAGSCARAKVVTNQSGPTGVR